MDLPWLIALLAVAAALACAYLWQRARALALKLEIERHAAERAFREADADARKRNEYLNAHFAADSDAVMLIAPDRTIIHLNDSARALFGEWAVPGQTLMTATRSVELDEMAAHVLAGGEDNDRQIMINNLPHRVRAVAAGPYGLAVELKDLSELQRLGRARRDFIANISHELRTPLTSIRLVVESLLTGAARDPATAHGLLQKINTEVRALEQMAQELLDLAQIESGQAIVKLLPTPVDQIVHDTVERLRPQAEHKALRLNVTVPPDLIALADADLVNRALGNLLHNAIKFTPPQGEICVQARSVDGDTIEISVSDTGPGIPPQDLPRVFERFFRGDRARRNEGPGGTGLGLAIAKHVVEAHGGTIRVQSAGLPGKGATFSFTLLSGTATP
jgi:two-component system phosphate regulon sensor histidine kinase PhoR